MVDRLGEEKKKIEEETTGQKYRAAIKIKLYLSVTVEIKTSQYSIYCNKELYRHMEKQLAIFLPVVNINRFRSELHFGQYY